MRVPPSRPDEAQFARVYALSKLALPLLQQKGEWQEVENYPGKVRAYEFADLMMLHRTPFQPVPISQQAVAAGISALTQRQAARAYGLDVWWQQRKVLSVIWNDGGQLGLVLFKAGQWEGELERLAVA